MKEDSTRVTWNRELGLVMLHERLSECLAFMQDLAFYAFPSLQQLQEATDDNLRAEGFGYRWSPSPLRIHASGHDPPLEYQLLLSVTYHTTAQSYHIVHVAVAMQNPPCQRALGT